MNWCVLLVVWCAGLAYSVPSNRPNHHLDDNLDDFDDLYQDLERRSADPALLVAEIETEDLEEVDEEDADKEEDDEEDGDDGTDLPEEWDLRNLGIIRPAIYQGSGCGSCGWVSGTQALESRTALVSENYVPYSIQNFMNCVGKVCVGAQPYSVFTQARKSNNIVKDSELPYTKKACLKWGPDQTGCKCGAESREQFSNVLDEQFVVIAGTRGAHTEAHLMRALQTGPVTTCFSFANKEQRALHGERCVPGCLHANSIIGYTRDKFLLRESYGETWGKFSNGTWVVTKGSVCAGAILKKAYYPLVLYDYDRYNSYFRESDPLDEATVTFIDKSSYGISSEDTENVGKAKNKCAVLGPVCKGVLASSDNEFELVQDFGNARPGDQKAFAKVQMVVYLKHEETGNYVGIEKTKDGLKLALANYENRAPFITSYGRLISFEYPTYRLAGNELVEGSGILSDDKERDRWTLNDCVLHNTLSGMALDLAVVGEKKKAYYTPTGSMMDKTVASQRFDVGISGTWTLISRDLGMHFARRKEIDRFVEPDDKKSVPLPHRWMARQILNQKFGKAFNQNMEVSATDFDIADEFNAITPTDCLLSFEESDENLAVLDGEIEVSSDESSASRWTFEYGDF